MTSAQARAEPPRPLDVIVEPRLAAHMSIARDSYLLHEVAVAPPHTLGVLRIYALVGDVISLGRYHVAPVTNGPRQDITVCRRHSGGRAVPWGEGFLGISLVLPHRSALVAPGDPRALAPAQVMNRCVRGILGGLERLGVPALYPGRDFVTAAGRRLGLVSFEVDAAGALLFEAVVAVDRDLSTLPALLDAVDPGGVVPAEMITAAETTSVAAVLGRSVGTDELAACLRRGYEERLGLRFQDRAVTDAELAAAETLAQGELADERWLAARRPRADHDRSATVATQLGVLQVHGRLTARGSIEDVLLAGDLIANSPAMARLERELRGCPAEEAAMDAVVREVFVDPDNWILGIGPLSTLTGALRKAFAS